MSRQEAACRAKAAWWELVFRVFLPIGEWAFRIADHAAYRQYRCSDRAEFLRETREKPDL